jgi:hypothetical protein
MRLPTDVSKDMSAIITDGEGGFILLALVDIFYASRRV